MRNLLTALALTIGLLGAAPTAHAAQPLDVDCDLLAATNDAVNDVLDAAGIQFRNLGELIALSIKDDNAFQQLRDLILQFSGGEIEFTSGSQIVSTNGKCGLIPQLAGNVRD
jgi:hypothetical protein